MDCLFLGGVFDKKIEKEILKKTKGIIHYAANKFQWNLIDGLNQLDNIDIEILSAPIIASYPKEYSDFHFKGTTAFYKNKNKVSYVSFNNLWGYRNISRRKSLIHNIKSFALLNKNKCILISSVHTPYLQAAAYAKKIDPSIHICLIVPDLPQFMNLKQKRSLIYNFMKRIDITIFTKTLKQVDSFVLLTEAMKEKLLVGKRPYVVIEGIVNTNLEKEKFENKNESKNLVYTGTLNRKFGVVNLMKAFQKVKTKNIYLKICGRGDSEDLIKEYSRKDNRIKFLGQLTNEQAVSLQNNATVLINPRQNNEEFTKYSFPSKNMEYLLTGNPVIAYKLDGIPDDYDEYFYYVEDNSIESLTKKIEEVFSMNEQERNLFGQKGKEFVLREKNNYQAAKKIMEMIEDSRRR